MATLTGILVDVSGSMQTSIEGERNQRNREWARTNFDLVNELILHDVSSKNHVFALGFGASREPTSFDLLNTIEKSQIPCVSAHLSHRETLSRILDILEANGAPRVKHWGKMNVLLSVIDEQDGKRFLDMLSANEEFKRRFAHECLPDECRRFGSMSSEITFGFLGLVGAEGIQGFATENSVREAVKKGKNLLSELSNKCLIKITDDAVMDVHKAQKILQGSVRRDDLTDQRIDELMEQIRPFIYGSTPLIETLNVAKRLFSMRGFEDYEKLLFILSDGDPTDYGNPPISELTALGVRTVSCYITNNKISDPKRLYSRSNDSWNEAAMFMFRISSTITTQLIPRTAFVRRGWKIDIDDNKTKLFVQVNHPDIIKEVCDLARDVVCCQDALSDLLSCISLDLYINQANEGFHPKKQRGGTCYANASAAVLHLAMKRIVGRDGGYPDFFQLRQEMIAKYGQHGANTLRVLQEMCPKYRLHCKEVDVIGAMKAVAAKRPVLARFRLTDDEWDRFEAFFQNQPCEILSSNDLRIRRPTSAALGGHAVVLTSYDSQALRLMNSWGDRWADGGFFRVSDKDALGLEFVDVYWTTSDLTPSEIAAYDSHGVEIAQRLMSRLKGLQTAQYECPLCHQQSGLSEFNGNALSTRCPKCKGTFRIVNPGDDLALNLYLLSLSGRRFK